jgi:UMF1 family MFS transporter
VDYGGWVLLKLLFYYLPNNVFHKKPEEDYIFKGFKELMIVFKKA